VPQGHADDRHDPDDLASGEYSGLRLPQQPIDVGEDVDTVAEEVSEFNWYNDSKADGGSGACQGSTVTQCLKPLSLKTGWTSDIVPGQARSLAVVNPPLLARGSQGRR
jgi:hypothetical protein